MDQYVKKYEQHIILPDKIVFKYIIHVHVTLEWLQWTENAEENLRLFFTFLETTLMTSVAMALGEYLSLEVATTGNWYSMK